MSYAPPYTLTPEILTLVARIAEKVGELSARNIFTADLRLRKINRIRTIHGSLAIEGNTLSEEHITAILEGRQVIAPPREIQEVRNALAVYERFDLWRPEKEQDLLEAHGIMMSGLIEEAGQYRSSGVGVMDSSRIIHMAPPARQVPQLMNNLFAWLGYTDIHPLVAGAVFHYELEFVHPFADGNGRMGRLWQNLILARWNPIFSIIPVENLVFKHQTQYYHAIGESTRNTDSAPFIHFMLEIIEESLNALTPQVNPQLTPQVKKLLLTLDGEMSRAEIQDALGLKDRKSFRERYLLPALKEKLVEMLLPHKPNSRFQRYRLTPKGRSVKDLLEEE